MMSGFRIRYRDNLDIERVTTFLMDLHRKRSHFAAKTRNYKD